MSNRRPRGRYVPPLAPPRTSDTAHPVLTQTELADFLIGRVGCFMLHNLHEVWCPVGQTTQDVSSCRCTPDVYLKDYEGRIIAEVRP